MIDNNELNNIVFFLVNKFQSKNDLSSHVNNSTEDLVAEAKIAAVKALRTFNSKKKTKISTYVFTCVQNRLKDLKKNASRQPNLIPTEDDKIPVVVSATDQYREFEHDQFMRNLLTEDEYRVYVKIFHEDYSIIELSREFCRTMSKREIEKCYHRILKRYKSVLEGSPSWVQREKKVGFTNAYVTVEKGPRLTAAN